MEEPLLILLGTAFTLGFVHTIFGPDHYLPFVMLSEARNWSHRRTVGITLLSGFGHVLGSVALGFIGIAAGLSISHVKGTEALRGDIASWSLMAFGLLYALISAWRLYRNPNHTHTHANPDKSGKTTPWVIFLIFVFGPCEPLIPLLMYPAAQENLVHVAAVAGAFSLTTVLTMIAAVMLLKLGFGRITIKPLQRYAHILAGAVIFLSGAAIVFLGL